MAERPLPDDLVRRWTEPVLRDPDVRRDPLAHCRGPPDKEELVPSRGGPPARPPRPRTGAAQGPPNLL